MNDRPANGQPANDQSGTLHLVMDGRFVHTPHGVYQDGQAGYAHWARYLLGFAEVVVVARSRPQDAAPPGWTRVDGPGVRALPVPFYQGPGELLRALPGVLRALRGSDAGHMIVRFSGLLAHLAAARRALRGLPYGVEVVNDPLAGYGGRAPGRALAALTRAQLRRARAVSYVTAHALQRAYPPPPGRPHFAVSDVLLPPEAFSGPRAYAGPARHAVLVGTLEQNHKGVDVALQALARLRAQRHHVQGHDVQGHDFTLTVVGDGPLRPVLEEQARALGLQGAVIFAGGRGGPQEVRQDLQAAELLLMPSRTEGLPRALIEALAQGLPAIASAVGGIPELLPEDALVPPGDPAALAARWGALAGDPAALTRHSRDNFTRAQDYAEEPLQARRAAFWAALKGSTTLPPKRIVYTTTTNIAMLAFYAPQLRHLRERGHAVHFVTPAQPEDQVRRTRELSGATHHALEYRREISPKHDLQQLLGLLGLLGRLRPDIVNFSTPKAGLLGGLASALLGVPLRVYFVHGLRSETAATGPLARLTPLLRAVERLTVACAHEVLCTSPSNMHEAVELGLAPAHKIRVLGLGSPAGIPVARYAGPDPAAVARARAELGLPEGTPVVGFVGRLAPQKGVEDLLEAWEILRGTHPDARLLLVGTPDPANPLSARAQALLARAAGVVQLDFEADMARLYPLMSVTTLPSRHEGLGMVVLEAAAAGVPAVLTDAPGVRDAGVPGVTALQVPARDPAALAAALGELLDSEGRRRELGGAAQAWVAEHFEEQKLFAGWDAFYAQAWARHAGGQRRRRALVGAALLGLGLWALRRR